MNSVKKNILVGVTVIGAFAVLGWMIVQFGGRLGTLAAGSGYLIRMDVPRVDGLAEGNQVKYLGTTVGRIETITLNDQRTGFRLRLNMKPDIDLPANVHGVVRATNLISGGAAIDLELNEPGRAGPGENDSASAAVTRTAAQQPAATGSLEDVAGDRVLEGTFAGADLIPPEFATLATQARELIADVRRSGLVDNLNAQVSRIGEVADNVNATIGDTQLRDDIKEAVASAKQTSETVRDLVAQMQGIPQDVRQTVEQTRQAGQNANVVLERLASNVQQLDKVLGDFRQISGKINDGQGTAGALLNDDRLYRELVETTRLLETTVKTVNRLTAQWEEEGIKLRL